LTDRKRRHAEPCRGPSSIVQEDADAARAHSDRAAKAIYKQAGADGLLLSIFSTLSVRLRQYPSYPFSDLGITSFSTTECRANVVEVMGIVVQNSPK